ncbi:MULTISPECIES: inovirus Gp2 family protein [unclassified Serratia (in: enterobacteria)]|uniref:inovirus Gp2 family protein n=1 Tax=unclassified Serratia (in: enterobacteria) TaxID=2647522 RepID=UPI003076249F
MRLITSHGPLCKHYLDRLEHIIEKALECHHRILAVRVDLRLPDTDIDIDTDAAIDSAMISRNMASLKAQIKADLNRKRKANKRVHPCILHYVWVKEINQEGKKHYHVLLLLNRDAYAFLGDYRKENGTLSSMICKAWISALRLEYPENKSLVYFPQNPCYYLDYQKAFSENPFSNIIYRASYMTKFQSKCRGKDERSFGSSQF